MKILLIARRLNYIQSAPKCNLNLALALAKLNHEVYILTSHIDSSSRNALITNRKIKIFMVDTKVIFEFKAPYTYSYYAKRLKEKYNIDFIIGNGYTLFDDITWVHTLRRAWINKFKLFRYPIPLKLKAKALLEEIVLRSSKNLWAPSKMVMRDLIKLYNIPKNKIFVVHNGVDINYYRPLPRDVREELRRKLGLEDKTILLFVGSTNYFLKGFHVLLRELTFLKHKKDLIVLMAGVESSNDLNTYLHKLAINNIVKILGFIDADRLRLYYQFSDFFILPSLYDAFSLATLEAMACGAIPIVSIYSGISEIIRPGINGYIVNPLVKGALSTLINSIISSLTQNSMWKLRANVINTARVFSWNNVAKRLIAWLSIS